MPCHEFETLIVDSLDASSSEGARAALDTHLAACAGCRAFAGAQKTLDARLAASLASVVPPAHFKARVLARVRAERSVPRAERLPWTKILDAAAWLASVGAVSFALAPKVPRLAAMLPPVPAVPPDATLITGYAAGAAALAFGLYVGLGREARKIVREWV